MAAQNRNTPSGPIIKGPLPMPASKVERSTDGERPPNVESKPNTRTIENTFMHMAQEKTVWKDPSYRKKST